jgi:copper oxidase (laccase) domain-containing protein
LHASGTAQQFTLWKTADRTSLCAISSVKFHACSACTFAQDEFFSNRKSQARCAKTVDEVNCLWNLAEKPEKIARATAA